MLETDATGTGGMAGTAPVSKCQLLDAHDQPSASSLANKTEVLLLGLKPGTWYKATVYSQAQNGTEGQPMDTEFRTSMLNFIEWLQLEFLAQNCVFCDSGSELALASQVVLLADAVFWKRFGQSRPMEVLNSVAKTLLSLSSIKPGEQAAPMCTPGACLVFFFFVSACEPMRQAGVMFFSYKLILILSMLVKYFAPEIRE